MLRLYDFLSSGNGYKVRLLLHKLDVPYERAELNIMKGETRTPEFLAKNPNGRIPALELEDGTVLAESDAILFYLAEGTPFMPADRLGRAQVLQWMFFEQYSHEPNIAVAHFIRAFLPEDNPRRSELPRLYDKGDAALGVMERHLAPRRFMVGESLTIADIALYAYTHLASKAGFDLSAYPSVESWLRRVAAEPDHIPITKS
jgi:glutathione S-transferase